jgi:predicted membrane chloride channel (bestrophin family)
MNNNSPTGNQVFDFFEHPRTFSAKFVQFIIFLLIIASVVLVVIEFGYPEIQNPNASLFEIFNYVILAVFTIEYVLRVTNAPNKGKFFVKPLNLVDFFAVFPNYLELLLPLIINTTGLRALRLLRLARILRGLRLFKYGVLLSRIFKFQKTILQTITPVIILFAGIKTVVWILEYNNLWFVGQGLGELFAIIGFALGIILSQKIGVSYDKFIQVEEAVVRLYGTLQSLSLILNKHEPGLGDKTVKTWAKRFLQLLKNPESDNRQIHKANDELYEAIAQVEKVPSELAILHGDVARDAAFSLSKKVRLIPKAYDTLLHQSTMLYLLLIAVFIPGVTGMLSVLVGVYILYGMYNVTQDFDSIIGGEFDLININVSELEYLSR